MSIFSISPVSPHDLELSLRLTRSFSPERDQDLALLRKAVRIHDRPTVLELRQLHREPPLIEIRTDHRVSATEAKRMASWIILADLDLKPFYRLAASHPTLGPITKELRGLKPMRPPTLFEMLVIAITEQQISTSAAFHIRSRLIERYGDPVKDLWVFPTPESLSASTVTELMKCGLSRRKAEYVKGMADSVTSGTLDLNQLLSLPDEDVRTRLLGIRGLGPWSAEYFLVRGLGRSDRVPSDDLGIRSIVGHYLGRGQRLSPTGVMRKLSPFRPYRGLAAFYLLAHARLSSNSSYMSRIDTTRNTR